MSGTHMYLKDGRVWTTWRCGEGAARDDGLVLSRHDLAAQISFINDNHIECLNVTLGDPRVIVDRSYREALLQRLQQEDRPQQVNHDTDLSPLCACPQLVQLTLEGNLLNSGVLAALPCLHTLNLDNTLGKQKLDLSRLSLHTLYLQKPGRNVRGFEQIASLRHLAIWNYQPKSRDLSELHALKNLRSLMLIQPRVDTLEGVDHLSALDTLEIYHARTLKDTSALERCGRAIAFFTDPNHAG